MARNLLNYPEFWKVSTSDTLDSVKPNDLQVGDYWGYRMNLRHDIELLPGDYVEGEVKLYEHFDGEYGGYISFLYPGGLFGIHGIKVTTVMDFHGWSPFMFRVTYPMTLEAETRGRDYFLEGRLAFHVRPAASESVVLPEIDGCAANFNCQCEDPNPSRTLAELRQELLMRLGYAAVARNPPPGMPALLDSFLQGAQRFLYRTYPVLRTERFYTWDMQAGSRFYDLSDSRDECPRKLDARMVSWVGVSECNDQWRSLTCGIPPESYGRHDKQGAPDRYEIRQCIEVWPAPDERRWKLRIKGDFGLEPFAADGDRCTIDDEAVLLHALARAKAHYGHPDAANYERDALTYIKHLTAGAHHTRRYVPGTRGTVPDGWPGFMWEGL